MSTALVSDHFHRWFEFLFEMTEKEIKARYKFVLFGFLWIIFNPILQMLVIGFVFQFFIPIRIEDYFQFLFAGLLPWNFFSYTVSKNTSIIVFERFLIKKAVFPREAIPLSIVLSNFFHFSISLFLFLLFLMVLSLFTSSFIFAMIPMYLFKLFIIVLISAWLLGVTSGFSLMFSTLNVKYRDIDFFVKAIMPLWFYVTPVVYQLDSIPSQFHYLFYLNPLTGIITLFQAAILNYAVPPTTYILLSASTSIIALLVGLGVFSKESKYFDDWL
jgi:lipopolysaccharide transport system permease protein